MEEKKQIERLLMEYFRHTWPEFPKGKLMASESPDFILNHSAKVSVGIELTRLHPANHKGGLPGNGNSVVQQMLVDKVQELVEAREKRGLFVKFLFYDAIPVTQPRLLALSAQTAVAIRNALPSGKQDFFSLKINPGELPAELLSVLVLHWAGMDCSVWERANLLGASDDVVEDIRHSIRKKDEKLSLYLSQRLRNYWLLITTDRLTGLRNFNIENKIANHSFSSGFHRVFLFEIMNSRIFQLV